MKKCKVSLVFFIAIFFIQGEIMSQSSTFINSGQLLGAPFSSDVEIGDLDGDGDLDVVLCSDENPDINPTPVMIFLNDGSGLLNNSNIEIIITAIGSALGDLDGDGDLDGFLVCEGANRIFINDGLNSFATEQLLGDSYSRDVALGDLDNDGDLDAFVANSSKKPDIVWINNGNAFFTENGQVFDGDYSSEVALGDLDNDGDLDAVLTQNYGNNKVKILLNNGSGSFTDSGIDIGLRKSESVSLGDVDGDGDLDGLVDNQVFINKGLATNGIFQTLDNAGNCRLGDLDNDGDLDVFGTGTDMVWRNDGTGFFESTNQSRPTIQHSSISLADMDNDGDMDSFMGGSNYLWLNDGSANFTYSLNSLSAPFSTSADLGDVDADGDLDVLVGVKYGLSKIYFNDGDGFFYDVKCLDAVGKLVSLNDFDGDGDLDAHIGNKLLFNNGQGDFSGNSIIYSGIGCDLDDDGDLDLLHCTSDNVQVYFNNGIGEFESSGQTFGYGIEYYFGYRTGYDLIDLNDFDGDVDVDVYVGQRNGWENRNPSQLWLNDGDGYYQDSFLEFPFYQENESAQSGDLDNDNDIDGCILNYEAFIDIYENINTGFVSGAVSLDDFMTTSGQALGDVDNDNDLDIFVSGVTCAGQGGCNHQSGIILFNDGEGSFYEQEMIESSGKPILGDLDGDGDLDAFLINALTNQMSLDQVWFNQTINDQKMTEANSRFADEENLLLDVYPNPFQSHFSIRFKTACSGQASLVVYNLAGQKVQTVFAGFAENGITYQIEVDGKLYHSGHYYCLLRTKKHSQVIKLISLN